MHVRIPVEHLDDLIAAVDNAITRNLEYVSDDQYAEASGYARGGLMGMQVSLKMLRSSSIFEDEWDNPEIDDCDPATEDMQLPAIPEFPSIYR